MNNNVRNMLKTIGKCLGFDKLFWYFYGMLQGPPLADYSEKVMGVFTDSFGNKIELLAGLRDRLKPDWRLIFCPDQSPAALSTQDCLTKIRFWRNRLNIVDGYLRAFRSL